MTARRLTLIQPEPGQSRYAALAAALRHRIVAGEWPSGTPLPAETARDLVVTGPYAHVRNPMAVAGVVQTVGVGLWWGSWMVAGAGLTGAVVWDLLIRPTEEADLANRFGELYQRYAQHVRCWLPRYRHTSSTD